MVHFTQFLINIRQCRVLNCWNIWHITSKWWNSVRLWFPSFKQCLWHRHFFSSSLGVSVLYWTRKSMEILNSTSIYVCTATEFSKLHILFSFTFRYFPLLLFHFLLRFIFFIFFFSLFLKSYRIFWLYHRILHTHVGWE